MTIAILTTLLYILFVLAAIVLVVVILLQEGKGGGFGDALGTAGQQAFGVKASGVQRFTAGAAIVLLTSAILIHVFNRMGDSSNPLDGLPSAPVESTPTGAGGVPPAGG
jgi:preprotein translocase subunit SecG